MILDIVDQSRVLVDGPKEVSGVERQTIPLRQLSLTSIHIKIGRGARPSVIHKAYAKEKVLDKWRATPWFKKQEASAKRQAMGDFDRFKLMIQQKKKSKLINIAVGKLRRAPAAADK